MYMYLTAKTGYPSYRTITIQGDVYKMLMTMNTYKNMNYVKANSSQRIFKSLETTFWERVALTNDRCLYNSTYILAPLFRAGL